QALLAGWPARRVERGLEEVGVVHTRNLDWILERHEHALARARFGIHREQIPPVVQHLPRGHLVFRVSRQHASQCAFARTVRSHDRVDLSGIDRQMDPAKDPPTPASNVQVCDCEHCDNYPTLPSSVTLSSFCASTANSIGNWRKTSRQNPLTIRLTASSVERPR